MGDSVGRVMSYIVVALGIVLAVMLFMMRIDETKDGYVKNEVTNFVDVCRTTGEISPNNYRDLYSTVYGLDDYTISMQVDRRVVYPNDDGTTRTEWRTIKGDTILDEMYGTGSSDQESYNMKAGDMLTVSITRNSASTSSRMLTWFTQGRGDVGMIIVKYSGTVGNYGG